jgi:hypothetical protein
MHARHAFAILLLISIFGALSITRAGATGTMRVQQSDGTVQVYHGVQIRVAQRTLRIGSKDRKGVLVIDRAACTYAGSVLRCLPSTMKFEQAGKTHEIQLITGTIYVNLTDDMQQLHHSSTQLSPHDVLLMMQTQRGTYISLQGHIDEMQP